MDNGPISICAIGASAGGIKALQRLFSELPADLGVAYVVIVHLSPDHPSQLSDILGIRTEMPVLQVDDSPLLKPNCVYVIAPNSELVIDDGHITSRAITEERRHRAPIDMFFRSFAKARGDGIAVVLSGAGSDGSLGIKAVKEAGGVILVQDPSEAEFPMMPRNAIATGLVDFVGPIAYLAERIVDIVDSKKAAGDDPTTSSEGHLRKIIAFLRARTGHDFSAYKRNTVMRRVIRRMQVSRQTSLESYGEYLRDNPEEAKELFSDLLISVTMFFRDDAAFEALATDCIGPIFDRHKDDGMIRAWVVGCATGEEAYSIAILCLEEAARRNVHPQIQIFASDLDEGALSTAREGRYPKAIEADLSQDRLRRFFVEDGGHYRIRKEVRDLVLFSSHSALKDPPFIRLDLVACRNLLIYLERDLQRTLWAIFHYALTPGGFLFLGTAEAIDDLELFAPVDRDARIYTAKPTPSRHLPALPLAPTQFPTSRHESAHQTVAASVAVGRAHIAALEENAPPSILIDASQRVVHLSPSAGRFILPSEGAFSTELSQLVRPELRVDLKLGLQRALDHDQSTLTLPIAVAFDGASRRVVMHVVRVAGKEQTSAHALVFFLDGGPARLSEGENATDDAGPSDDVRRLNEALATAHERLGESRREHESATQELRAANEELQSINEEYRSTAEELETSKEELQSMNEELQTVNSELKIKLLGISSAHNDLQNLMAATEIGTLFLDEDLRIKLLTSAITTHFNITDADIGRAITDFTHRLAYDSVEDDARTVLRDLVPIEKEVATKSGRWLMLRIRPYRTVENRIEGVVLTLFDVTARREAEYGLRSSEERYRRLFESMDEGFVAVELVYDANERPVDLTCIDANPAAATLLRSELKSRRLREAVPEIEPDWWEIADRVCKTGQPERLELFVKSVDRWFEMHVSAIGQDGAKSVAILFQDVSDRKNWEQSQHRLVGELNHRVKNTLALVQSIARQTGKNYGVSTKFNDAFGSRLRTLADAHDILTSDNWRGSDLAALVERCLGAAEAPDNRFAIVGPSIHLQPNAVIVIAMAINELNTNAIKYGALSVPSGRVDIRWVVENGTGQLPHVRLKWVEHDGPRTSPPQKTGFGIRMLKEALAAELDGSVDLHFKPSGLECVVAFTVPQNVDRLNV